MCYYIIFGVLPIKGNNLNIRIEREREREREKIEKGNSVTQRKRVTERIWERERMKEKQI